MKPQERIRRVLKKYKHKILTRKQIVDACIQADYKDGVVFYVDEASRHYSAEVVKMFRSGKLDSYQLFGKEGYCLKGDDARVRVAAY